MTVGFIDDHRDVYGVEPICTVVRIAPSTSHRHRVRRLDEGKIGHELDPLEM